MSLRIFTALLITVLLTSFATADEQTSKTINSAKILLKNKDYDGARQMLAPIVEKEPDNADALFYLASSNESLGNIKEALDGYNHCLDRLKDDPNADANLKKQCQSAVNRLDEGRKIVLAHAKQMEQEAGKYKDKNEYAYATIMAAAKLLAGDDVMTSAGNGMQAKRHPKDAVAFQGHWYKFFDVPMTWHVAKRKCEEMGGYLACIETSEENAFLNKLRGSNLAYIGATDEEEEGTWKWVNGSAMRYTNWGHGQPDNGNGIENVLELYEPKYGGGWNDAPGDYRYGFICEWEK